MHRFDVQRLLKSGSALLGRNTSSHPLPREALDDDVVTARITMKLLAHPLTAAHEIHVETVDGVVALSGQVITPEVRTIALQLAEHAEGVQRVIDRLEVRRTD